MSTIKKTRPPKVPKKKSPPVLTTVNLRALAAKHQPPQSWFEEDLDEI
jgi:hypothetical protein